ncbi:DUF4291 domain-containing protein [Microscilla marina]|uniref:DUF4291 domain-containing protein n=1 Tax=Microscilla marina ATCC 23134 TaxID=313606 RepID=A1ZHU4_MICM2|nr:DUF4291 domain-containing protein [Microscilla marina]EAY30101.1 hypothetical protein M23134_05434 [Microscilla marina ATCC 23134]
MNLQTILYKDYETDLPQEGRHILGQMTNAENLIVYQAFNPSIAKYAVTHQQFGGSQYSFSRMSWIKPNFLWMMYRAGWASKPNQERILAIEISKQNFELILEEAIHSSYVAEVYGSRADWQAKLKASNVVMQWDPDHAPNGDKLQRRAVQLGLRNELLKNFGTHWAVSIQDITDFVLEQGKCLRGQKMDELLVMQEQVIAIDNPEVVKRLGLAV